MEIYFSLDIETDGPIPGKYSMLSFGVAAFLPDGKMIATYSSNLETLPEAGTNPDTMAWWKTQSEAWEKCRDRTQPPESVMPDFVGWVETVCKNNGNGRPVCVAYPAGFDWTFFYWYLIEFAGVSPFSFSCLDIKTKAAAILGIDYRKATKRNFPKHWFGKNKPHTHIALDDAIEQGEMFIKMMKHGK